MTPPELPSTKRTTTPSDLLRAVVATGILTILADYLFWNPPIGFSLAVYFCALAGAMLALGLRTWPGRNVWIASGLLIAASCATALEISFTNAAVLVALIFVITGECWYGGLPAGWARWSEPVINLLAAPARWVWLGREAVVTDWRTSGVQIPSRRNLARAFQIFMPAAFLVTVFCILLGLGNAVFGRMLSNVWDDLPYSVEAADFSTSHCLFWLFFATLALAFVRPRPAPASPRLWARQLGPVLREDVPVAVWQSRLVLLALNMLFFVVNTIDAIYLWWHVALPAHTNPSQFLHEGVSSLIVAVLLSAVVIAAIFQQQETVRRSRFLKAVAMLWIAQNLVLIAGVFLRLKLYVRAFQLTESRVYVACFLLLVIFGFALLAWHVVRDGDINALIFRCSLAVFSLFFLLQFADVAGPVARYNVARWKQDRHWTLDIDYLESLGARAWPALVEVAYVDGGHQSGDDVRSFLVATASQEEKRMESHDWRSWQWRRDHQSRRLMAWVKNLP